MSEPVGPGEVVVMRPHLEQCEAATAGANNKLGERWRSRVMTAGYPSRRSRLIAEATTWETGRPSRPAPGCRMRALQPPGRLRQHAPQGRTLSNCRIQLERRGQQPPMVFLMRVSADHGITSSPTSTPTALMGMDLPNCCHRSACDFPANMTALLRIPTTGLLASDSICCA